MLAQSGIRLSPTGTFLPLQGIKVGGMIVTAINLLMIVAVLFFFLSILTGAIRMMMSAGSKDKMDNAKRQLINALIGIVFIFSIWAIMSLVETLFGLQLLNFDIPNVQNF